VRIKLKECIQKPNRKQAKAEECYSFSPMHTIKPKNNKTISHSNTRTYLHRISNLIKWPQLLFPSGQCQKLLQSVHKNLQRLKPNAIKKRNKEGNITQAQRTAAKGPTVDQEVEEVKL
jgi:hypothetical protein